MILGLVLSLGIGISLGLLGGGGSILTVPILVYAMGLDGKQAIATSLLVVGVTSAAAMVPHARGGRVDFRVGLTFGAASMAGAFAGGRLAHFLPSNVLLVAFAVMMLVTGLAMLRPRADSVGEARMLWGRVLVIGVLIGVLTGVILGLSHFLHHRLHPRIIEVGLHPDGSLRDRHLWKLAPIAQQTYALRMDDELDFASASALERAVVEHLAAHPDVRHICLFAHPINRIDATGVEVFMQLCSMLRERGIALHISGIKLPVERVLKRAGALHEGPLLHMYRTDVDALMAFGRLSA